MIMPRNISGGRIPYSNMGISLAISA